MHQIPTAEPASIRSGDTWQWRREDLPDYPASTWTLTYRFRNATSFFDVVASADGDVFSVSVPAATTAAYTAGRYDWFAFVDDGTDRYQVDSGQVDVLADVAAAAAFDARNYAQRIVDAIEATLENRADQGQLDLVSSTADTLGYTRDRDSLIVMLNKFRIEAQRVNGSKTGLKRVVVRFNS